MNDQTTRTAIVTGAARGIGAAVARRLSQDGFAVAVLDLDEAACGPVVSEIEAAGGRALAVGVDVADEQAVQTAVTRVAEELGAPTVLVNNAGITRDNLLFKMTTDDWDAVMNVHLRGSFLMSKATQKYMTEAGWGRIVNLSSASALGNRGQANYAAAKAGLQGFTKTLAIELGKFGVTANAIAPGFIETEMTADTAARVGRAVRGVQGRGRRADPGRPGRPARGHRRDGVVLRPRGRRLRLRPGHLRRRRSARMRTFHGLDELEKAVGTHLGYSDWQTITQEQVNLFADATGDHQWIHVDPEKAAQGPVRHDDRARLPDPVAGPVPGLADLHRRGPPDGRELRLQQGAVPRAGPGGLAGPRRRGAARARDAGRRARRPRCGSPSSSRAATSLPASPRPSRSWSTDARAAHRRRRPARPGPDPVRDVLRVRPAGCGDRSAACGG